MKSSAFDGAPRPPARSGVLAWFVFQWLLIPIELVVRLVWNAAMFFGDGVNGADMRDPLARFMTPARLSLALSRDASRWEEHADRLFARLAGELRSGKFAWGTSMRYPQEYVSRSSGGAESRVKALAVDFREYRGAHYPAVQAAVARHGLKAKPCVDGDPSQGLWVHLADDPGIPVTDRPAA